MDRYRELVKRPVTAAVLGGIVGLILGLIIGWGIWPVQYYDAAPKDMQRDYREDYLRMTIESYAKNGDKSLATRRWNDLGKDASDLLAKIQLDSREITPGDLAKFNALVETGGVPSAGATQALPAGTQTAAPGGAPLATQAAAGAAAKPIATPLLLGILCLALLLIGAALVYMFLFRGKGRSLIATRERVDTQVAPKAEYSAEAQETPILQARTSFTAGNDQYDDSFSIDAPSGEFLGECGVGISEFIGVGDPKKVTAFEVWLFDKNHTSTVTKVLMSEFAYNDPQIRTRLAPKGEPVLVEPGQRILLEAANLLLEAFVIDMAYSNGPLAPNSAFDSLTLDLVVWPKPPAA